MVWFQFSCMLVKHEHWAYYSSMQVGISVLATLLHKWFWIKHNLDCEVQYTPSSTWPGFELMTSCPYYDSTFHVTQTPAPISTEIVTWRLECVCVCIILDCVCIICSWKYQWHRRRTMLLLKFCFNGNVTPFWTVSCHVLTAGCTVLTVFRLW